MTRLLQDETQTSESKGLSRIRQSFEAWRRSNTRMDPDEAIARDGFGEDAPYVNKFTRAMWIGWLACATTNHRLPDGGPR